MICDGLLSLVEEQLDLNRWELMQIKDHRCDLDFVVREGVVDFTNGGFTIFTKQFGGVLRNVELDQMYPDIIKLSPEQIENLRKQI